MLEHFPVPHPLIGKTAGFTIAVPNIHGRPWVWFPATLLGFECEQQRAEWTPAQVRERNLGYFEARFPTIGLSQRFYPFKNGLYLRAISATNLYAVVRDEAGAEILRFRHEAWTTLPWVGTRQHRTCFLAWQRFDFGSQQCDEF